MKRSIIRGFKSHLAKLQGNRIRLHSCETQGSSSYTDTLWILLIHVSSLFCIQVLRWIAGKPIQHSIKVSYWCNMILHLHSSCGQRIHQHSFLRLLNTQWERILWERWDSLKERDHTVFMNTIKLQMLWTWWQVIRVVRGLITAYPKCDMTWNTLKCTTWRDKIFQSSSSSLDNLVIKFTCKTDWTLKKIYT